MWGVVLIVAIMLSHGMFQHDLSKGKGIVIIGGGLRVNRVDSIRIGFELTDDQSDFFRTRKL